MLLFPSFVLQKGVRIVICKSDFNEAMRITFKTLCYPKDPVDYFFGIIFIKGGKISC